MKKYTHKPIRVVSNGFDLKRFDGRRTNSEEIRAFRKKYSLDGFPVLLYVGRLSYEKNINHLLKIIQSLKRKRGGVRLLIVGEEGLRNELESRSIKLGIKGNPIVISNIFQVRCSRLSKDVKYVMHK